MRETLLEFPQIFFELMTFFMLFLRPCKTIRGEQGYGSEIALDNGQLRWIDNCSYVFQTWLSGNGFFQVLTSAQPTNDKSLFPSSE